MEACQPTAGDQRIYKTYVYRRQEILEPATSALCDLKSRVYTMNDQTFHTPSFGDEEFDIPSIHGQHVVNGTSNSHHPYAQMHHAPQVGMMNPAQDGLSPPGGAPSYQQPLYLQEPHTPVTSHSAGAPAGNYMIQQQPGGQQRLLMMQPSQVMSGPPTPGTPTQATGPPQVYGSPQRASPPGTTSDDSDDSVPSQHSQLPGDAESLLPIHYCSASRQQQTALHQMGVGNIALKRSSPEPMDNGMTRGQMQKKPKVQKKKKKRDPNEPQKPVSAYALFFRDTQAAIKGQNPNASFGEVSKIVASMWDGLDSDHKSVYKQKTEVAKKEYLKALAAYRASLVSKGGEQENPAMFNHNNPGNPSYGNYYQGQNYGNGHSPQNYVSSTPAPQGYTPQSYPTTQQQAPYPGQPAQGYQPNPQQSPQAYPGGPMTHSPQTYQVPGQSPQNYQGNPSTSPQGCPPNIAQSPRSYQSAQSPPNYGGSGLPSPSYRQMQSQSPPMGAVHSAMPYHHPNQPMHPPHQHQYQQPQQQIQQQQIQQQQQQIQQQQQLQQQQQMQQQQQLQQQQMQQQQMQQQQLQQQQQQIQQQQMQQLQPTPGALSSPKHEGADRTSPNNNTSPSNPSNPQTTDQNENRNSTSCIRQGCPNPAVSNSEWEDEYCSNECVVSHCRDVFSSWVASNSNPMQKNFSAVK